MTTTESAAPGDALRRDYRTMLLARRVDERAEAMCHAGRLAHHLSAVGLEAVGVGSASALEAGDWLFPSYRELAVALERGVSVEGVFDQLLGNRADPALGRRRPGQLLARPMNLASSSALLGTQLTHAVGAAWGAKLDPQGGVAVAFFGEAAADSAPFHNALNFAGAGRVPVIFVGSERPGRLDPTLEARGVAYGVATLSCDGGDPVAVRDAVAAARARAVGCGEPTLIACRIDGEDPVQRAQALLRGHHGWTDADEQALEDAIATTIEDAEARASSRQAASPATMFDHVFGEPMPPHLADQRMRFEALPRREQDA